MLHSQSCTQRQQYQLYENKLSLGASYKRGSKAMAAPTIAVLLARSFAHHRRAVKVLPPCVSNQFSSHNQLAGSPSPCAAGPALATDPHHVPRALAGATLASGEVELPPPRLRALCPTRSSGARTDLPSLLAMELAKECECVAVRAESNPQPIPPGCPVGGRWFRSHRGATSDSSASAPWQHARKPVALTDSG